MSSSRCSPDTPSFRPMSLPQGAILVAPNDLQAALPALGVLAVGGDPRANQIGPCLQREPEHPEPVVLLAVPGEHLQEGLPSDDGVGEVAELFEESLGEECEMEETLDRESLLEVIQDDLPLLGHLKFDRLPGRAVVHLRLDCKQESGIAGHRIRMSGVSRVPVNSGSRSM